MSRTVAILGASADQAKFGNKSLRAHAQQGYTVYPVNPKGGVIEGLPAYQRLADVPVARLDRISVYLPPQVGLSTKSPTKAATSCGSTLAAKARSWWRRPQRAG
jgi:predicted CoA-binding protein